MPYRMGRITTKHIGRAKYVYVGRYVNGLHKTKSCGNAAGEFPASTTREVLVDVMRERIAAMESQVDQMIVEAEIRAVNSKADESPP